MHYHPDMKVGNENVKDVLINYPKITKEQKVDLKKQVGVLPILELNPYLDKMLGKDREIMF